MIIYNRNVILDKKKVCVCLSRLQYGVSGVQGGLCSGRARQTAALQPLLPLRLYSTLAGNGEEDGGVIFSRRNVLKTFGTDFLLSLFLQHDTCPVCRKGLNGEDSNTQNPPESPSLNTDPRTQERWSF